MSARGHRWMIIAVSTLTATVAVGEDTTYQSRKLYPQHKQQQDTEIYNSAVKVHAAGDAESRSLQQQELCKKLIQAEKFDEALKIAHEVASTRGINEERRAAHHYLIADIYYRKMQASPNSTLMQQNRQRAIQAANEVVAANYPAKWHTTEMANTLLQELQDPAQMQQVCDWVQKRQSGGCDTTKENFAQRQMAYMESAAKHTMSAGAGGFAAVKRTGSSLFGVFGQRGNKSTAQSQPNAGNDYQAQAQMQNQSSTARLAAAKPATSSFSSPWGANSKIEAPGSDRSTVAVPGGQVTFSQAGNGTSRARATADQQIASSNNACYTAPRAPIIIDGASVRRSTPVDSAVNQTDIAASLSGNASSSRTRVSNDMLAGASEVAPGVRIGGSGSSPYDTGQTPTRGAVKN